MKTIHAAVLVTGLCAGGFAFAQQKQAPSMWDAEAAKAAQAVVEQGLAAVEKLDAEGLRALATPDLVAYDIDLESEPIRMDSLDEAVAYIAAIGMEAKKMGAKVKFERTECDCRATSTLAYCLLEYDFVATTAGTRMVQPSQTTVVLGKSDGAWKWVHWHTSLSGDPVTEGAK
jgi:ketosteroid isomerase-like protein